MGLFNKKQKKAPSFQGVNELAKTLHKNLEFTATEQYKLIRANLDFTLHEDEKCPVIGITSSMRGEGKSTTAVNLAYVCAEKGSKVLLIDADLRIPSIAKKLDIESTPGLADLLRVKDAKLPQFQSYLMDNWFLLPSGDIPPNPSELLGSNRMESLLEKLKEMFDYIIIDLPPVNIVSDAAAISDYLSGMIVVIRQGYTEKKELERCFRQLKLANVKILGCVMNEADSGGGYYNRYRKYRYYRYYRYYQNYYYQSEPKGSQK